MKFEFLTKFKKFCELFCHAASRLAHAHFEKQKMEESSTLVSDSMQLIATQVVFFVIGWIFFVQMLFRDYELRHRFVQLIFCVNFTLSCTFFELIIFEIVDYLARSSRFFHWHLSLYLMLFMVIVVVPFYISIRYSTLDIWTCFAFLHK